MNVLLFGGKMSDASGQSMVDHDLWRRAEVLANRFLDASDRVVFDGIELAREHEAALANGVAADSEISRELFGEMGSDEVARDLTSRAIRVIHAWVS